MAAAAKQKPVPARFFMHSLKNPVKSGYKALDFKALSGVACRTTYWFKPVMFPLLGRSQAVRQRFLVPPFPGSIPGAPAI